MVYEKLLRFEEIIFDSLRYYRRHRQRKNGILLQHNPKSNPLALMAASRQIYDEARRMFYGSNTFMFTHTGLLSIFMTGIGPENVKLLRKVRCRNPDERDGEGGKYEDMLDHVRSRLSQVGCEAKMFTEERQGESTQAGVTMCTCSICYGIHYYTDYDYDYYESTVRLDKADSLAPRVRTSLCVVLRQDTTKPQQTNRYWKVTYETCRRSEIE